MEDPMSEATRPNIFPDLHYEDATAAVDWLGRAFRFEEQAVQRGEDGRVEFAALRLGTGMVLLAPVGADDRVSDTPDPLASPLSLYVVVGDPDAHHDRAKAAGARIVRELVDQPYGSREYSARDLEGNLWSFGTFDPYAASE
jgi:uncharacterized glyoxalase superfamily protein PhnB